MPTTFTDRNAYRVGIICALATEKAAVEAMLDEEYTRLPNAIGDDNHYSFGRIGAHHVVVACLPAGVIGKASAAAVARDVMRSFPIRIGLMVGICGGVWSEKVDVRLGDVIVSQPEGQHGGVVQWDMGKMETDGEFRRTGILNKPPSVLLGALQGLKARHERDEPEMHKHLEEMLRRYPKMNAKYGHQGRSHDLLFESGYDHRKDNDTCAQCDESRLVLRRPERGDDRAVIHYGNLASGDRVIKSGQTRDQIARIEGVLGFEMEAAGLMDNFPCLVIRGVCDYADSLKNDRWQPYAAAVAAAFAKELLGMVDAQGVEELPTARE